jgi:hypothetical protein
MRLRLYINPSVQGTGPKEPASSNLDCRDIAHAGKAHQGFRVHTAQKRCGFLDSQKWLKYLARLLPL